MKNVKLVILVVVGMILFSGCDLLKMDTMEGIDIITTSYPLEFITKTLYGDHSLVKSIYPDGTDTSTYEINDKLLDNYSKEDLFVYVSFGNDKDIAVKLLDRNKKLLIIDGSLGMSPDYIEELWLNPSNLLMVSQNIKNGLIQYINNNYLNVIIKYFNNRIFTLIDILNDKKIYEMFTSDKRFQIAMYILFKNISSLKK